MKLQEVDINRAQGLHLSEELNFPVKILSKNHVLTSDDVILLKQYGIQRIYGAWSEDGDINFNTALGIAAAKISGNNLGFRVDDRGFCEIAATADGLFEVYADRINKFNRFSKYFVLNTVDPFRLTKKGEIVARLEILTPLIPQDVLDELVVALSGNTALLNVSELRTQQAALLYTQFYFDENEKLHLSDIGDKLSSAYRPLNLNFGMEYTCPYTVNELGNAIELLLKSEAEIIFVAPALRNYTEDDVLATAVKSIADDIVCAQIPLFGGADLMIATKKNKKIICLPYNYAYIDAPLLENYIKLAIVKEKLQAYDFNHPENALIESISKVKNISQLIRSKAHASKSKASVAAVILAAGQSKRLGLNKLLYDVDGEPMLLKAVRAALKSDASPIFVVTGYQAEKIEEQLDNLDINIVYNPNYRIGLKTSINIGLQSVPDFCDGALLIPADMPNLTPQLLNKMIAKFDPKKGKQLLMANKDGVKSNPVLWSKALFQAANLVPENADIRPTFIEHADYTTLIKATAQELLDVNFKSELDTLETKR